MRFLPPVLVVAAILATTDAGAVECGANPSSCIDSDLLWFTPGATTFFSVASGSTIGPRRFGFGLGNSLQSKPIVLRRSASGPAGEVATPAVGTQLNTSFLFSYGVTNKLEVDLAAPVTFYQTGTGLSSVSGSSTNLNGGAVDAPANSVRDMRIGAAYALASLPRAGMVRGVGLVGRFDLSIPTGERESFGGDAGVVAIPSLVLENRIGPIVLAGQFGARLRKSTSFFDRTVGSQGYMAVGLAGAIDKKETLAITTEIFALPSLVKNGTSPIQWLGGLRWSGLLGGDLVIHGGAGGGFRSASSAQLLEPSWRAVLDIRYAPMALDRDGDGIPDRDDKCPDEKEDRDGFEDTDGCPDPDNDKDGIPDKLDKCPNEPEEVNGIEDTDGCPEPDRDFDGIKDVVDKCPDKPETKNGWQDDDGCPDEVPPTVLCADGKPPAKAGDKCDADHDGRTDDVDVCPLVAEDIDGIADEDGCPEKDADEDGIADQLDKCPLDPENIDGKADDDGCPEAGGKNLVSFVNGAIEVDGAVRFTPGSALVSKPMKAQIAMIAQRLQGLVDRGVEKIVIESWADVAGENPANEALATKRADAIAAALAAAGIPEGLIKGRAGDLADPPTAKNKPNWIVTVRTKRKAPLTGKPAAQPPSKP
jgi:OmpA-OmpF porin, OOP family